MRATSLWVLAFAWGCSGSLEEPPRGSGGSPTSNGGATSGGSSGGGLSSGGSTSGGSSGGGLSSGGSTSGGATSGGTSNGGASSGSGGSSKGGTQSYGGGNGAGMSGSGAGAGSGGRGSGGRSSGGAAGATSSGGASAGGSGGASGCVKNLACKLSPPPSTGDIYQDCVDRINQFLTQCACLPALSRRTDGEACANQMAEYDASKDSPHAGAIDNICQPSGSQNECPGYASNAQVIGLCMQQMWDEGPPPSGSCTGTCYEQHGHFINMTDKAVTKVACGFYTTASGEVWAVQNFSR